MLAEDNARQGFFEHDEFLALRAALPVHLRGFVTFAYKTVSEIRSLTWEHVDLKQGLVHLDPTLSKSKDGRTFYLDDELAEIMREQFSMRRLGLPNVFHHEGRPIGLFRKSWATACKKKGKLFHDLRRTAVRDMVRAGIPERVAMQVSGHKNRSVFDRYDITSTEGLKQAALNLSGHLGKLTGTKSGTIEKKRSSLMAQPLEINGALGATRTRDTGLGILCSILTELRGQCYSAL